MELDQFKIDFGQLNNYVNSTDKMVFWILSDGIWPYYYDEDSGRTVCRIELSSSKEFHETMKKFPLRLREYYKNHFKKGVVEDPFELLFIMLDSEKDFV